MTELSPPMAVGTMGGAIFFEEYKRFAWYTSVCLPIGVGCVCAERQP